MKNVYKVALVSLFTVGMSSAACKFDLRHRNLAQPIKDIVAKANANNTYNSLPQFIKDINTNMQANNYSIEGLPLLKKTAHFVSAYTLAHLNPLVS